MSAIYPSSVFSFGDFVIKVSFRFSLTFLSRFSITVVTLLSMCPVNCVDLFIQVFSQLLWPCYQGIESIVLTLLSR